MVFFIRKIGGDDLASISELAGGDLTQYHMMKDQILNSIRVAMPATIESFDHSNQTATVKPCINDRIVNKDGKSEWTPLPLIMDVPVQVSQCKDYAITFPIQSGDPCMLIFQDKCIDAFMQSGNDSVQAEIRHHDLSDAIAIIGISPSNNLIKDYDSENLVIRHKEDPINIKLSKNNMEMNYKSSKIDLNDTEIKLTASVVDVNGTKF